MIQPPASSTTEFRNAESPVVAALPLLASMHMCDLVKWLIRNALIGYALAGVLIACMWIFDVGNFAGLIGSQDSWIVLLMLFFFIGGTFACWQISIALMLIGDDGDARPSSGLVAVGTHLLRFVREKSNPLQNYRCVADFSCHKLIASRHDCHPRTSVGKRAPAICTPSK